VLPRPEGQRCLVVAGGGRTVSRTRAGRLLRAFPSALPGAGGGPCVLDCVFHEPGGAFYVQDLMCWRGYALYDCSAAFRLFWLASKLGESGAGAPPGPRHRFPFLPVAAFACDPGAPPAPARGAAAASPPSARASCLLRRASGRAPHRPCHDARHAAARAGGLHAALRGAVPFVRDGVALLHKEGHYALGPTPLALLWKDARCSRFHLDTDAAGAAPALQPVTLQCLPGGAVGTGDERPVALGRVPEAALQQLGERLRRATDLPFDGGLGWICGSGCSQVRLLREVDRPERARPAHVFAGALQAACTLQAIGLVRQEPVRAGARRAADQVRLPRRPGRLLRFALAGGGLDMGPDGCPTGADLRYEGPANQRRAKADTLSKVRLNVFFRALRLLVHR